MIKGVQTKKLKVIPDERGRLMEILRDDDDLFQKFGQAYITVAYPGAVKGWHFHNIQTDHFACVSGMIKLVLYDRRDDSPTKGKLNEFFIGEHNAMLVTIPPGVVHGIKCISVREAILLNLPTEHYNYENPDEQRFAHDDPSIPYDWARKDG